MKKALLIFVFSLFGFFIVPVFAGNLHAEDASAGTWVQDSEVTFVGKTAARSGSFLDWTLENYNWVQLGTNEKNPLISFWIVIRNIVYAIFALFILATAFMMILTRGKNISFAKFIPRFIGILLLVTFSFGVVQIIYQVSDIVQGFFLRNPDQTTQAAHAIISQQNLLNIGFDYDKFVGYRMLGSSGDESAAITLLLTKLTAVTYYAMSGMLIIRKIVMWFFIIISPIFPLLLFYWPIRNTAKIWIGEFFRWTLYGPLFALLLAGLVSLWSSAIPLFAYQSNGSIITKSTQIIYPTVVNILLGGPGQAISITNSVNLPETFALYMICLMMLWAVLILPFILLRIFLDYLFNLSLGEGIGAKQFLALSNSFLNRPPPQPSPPPALPAGLAKVLPFSKKLTIPENTPVARTVVPVSAKKTISQENLIQSRLSADRSVQADSSRTGQVMRLMNLSVPTMRDVAQYESTQLQSQVLNQTNLQTPQAVQNLKLLANPQLATTPTQREQYEKARDRLMTESRKGNVLASNILSAANMSVTTQVSIPDDKQILITILNNIESPQTVSQVTEKATYEQVKETVQKESQRGNPLASLISQYLGHTKETAQIIAPSQLKVSSQKTETSLPELQSVVEALLKPQQVTDPVKKETIRLLREEITKETILNTPLAVTFMSFLNGSQQVNDSSMSTLASSLTPSSETDIKTIAFLQSITSPDAQFDEQTVAKFIQELANPTLSSSSDRTQLETIRQTIVTDATSGSPLAKTLLPVVQSSQNITPDLVRSITKLLSEVRGTVRIQSLFTSLLTKPVSQETKASPQASSIGEITIFIQTLLHQDSITDPKQKETITSLLSQLRQEAEKGDVLAKDISNLVDGKAPTTQEALINLTQQIRLEETKQTPTVVNLLAVMNSMQKQVSVERVKDEILKAKDTGDKLGSLLYSMLLSRRQKKSVGQKVSGAPTNFPVTNRIQTVSIEDYEAVKKIWKDNYKNLDNPMRNGQKVNKGMFIKDDIDEITLAVNLLSSATPQQQQEGMNKVSTILPFLLLGGFSQTEIVGYLKAKQEAAKEVLEDVSAKEEDEETKVERKTVTAQNTAHLTAEAEVDLEEKPQDMSEKPEQPLKTLDELDEKQEEESKTSLKELPDSEI
jgi:hypothetical protein